MHGAQSAYQGLTMRKRRKAALMRTAFWRLSIAILSRELQCQLDKNGGGGQLMRLKLVGGILVTSALLFSSEAAFSQGDATRKAQKSNRKSLDKSVEPGDFTTGVCKDFCWLNPDMDCCKRKDDNLRGRRKGR